MQQSLPLFDDSIEPDLAASNRSAGKVRDKSVGGEDHLASAKRLSRAMRRIPSNSQQQIRAGRLVCRHLLAMLHDGPVHCSKNG